METTTIYVLLFLALLWGAFCIHETIADRKFAAKVKHEQDINQSIRIANIK